MLADDIDRLAEHPPTRKKNEKVCQVMQNEVFLWQQNGPRFFPSELFCFSANENEKKPAAYAPEKGTLAKNGGKRDKKV